MALFSEMLKRHPEFIAQIMATNPDGPGASVPTIPTIHGPMLMLSEIGACNFCRVEAEKAAAHQPSWCLVEIDAGPNPTNKISAQVPNAN